MTMISASVGLGGANIEADAFVVQRLLNVVILALGLPLLVEDGDPRRNTILAIQAYQRQVMGHGSPDGRIDPGGPTWTALAAGKLPKVKQPSGPDDLSGGAWWDANQARYPNSAKLDDLVSPFRENCKAFTSAMIAAGAQIEVGATLRDPGRAKLMLYCWQVSRGELAPGSVPAIDGCTIRWDHGDAAKSRAAAREMVKRFNIASQPSLGVSLHTKGRAIDMTITWTGTMSIRDADGATHAIGAPHSAETNTTLQNVGRSYGVIKLIRPSKPDVPHWSDNGT